MDDPIAFLDAIRDAPDDDAHRLVYADWLDERDQGEQAAFLRAHVALARFLGRGDDPFARPGELDVMNLRPALRDALLAPLAPLAADLPRRDGSLAIALPQSYRLLAHRGLVECLEVGNQLGLLALATRGQEVLARVPIRFVALAQRPWWLPADERGALGPITDQGMEAFLSSGAIDHLEAIDFRTFYLGDPQVAILVRHTKPLRRLRVRLYVRGGPMHPHAYARRLAEAFGPQLIAVPPIADREVYDDSIPF
jgi:uncharacterized protein (TIGR02996 family)